MSDKDRSNFFRKMSGMPEKTGQDLVGLSFDEADDKGIQDANKNPCVKITAVRNRAPRINIRCSSGEIRQLAYGDYMMGVLRSNTKLDLLFPHGAIALTGENLDKLLMYLQREMVLYIEPLGARTEAKAGEPTIIEVLYITQDEAMGA